MDISMDRNDQGMVLLRLQDKGSQGLEVEVVMPAAEFQEFLRKGKNLLSESPTTDLSFESTAKEPVQAVPIPKGVNLRLRPDGACLRASYTISRDAVVDTFEEIRNGCSRIVNGLKSVWDKTDTFAINTGTARTQPISPVVAERLKRGEDTGSAEMSKRLRQAPDPVKTAKKPTAKPATR
jgi:hypothetical protein